MLKKIKLKNSTLLLLGIIIITLGICIGLYEYFVERKNKTFQNMSIVLYENEQPQTIIQDVPDDEIKVEIETEREETEPKNENIPSIENNKPIVRNYLGVLEIPKINLKKGFYGLDSKYNNVDLNVTVINGSTFPGEKNNNLILAAHSGDCNYCYFDKLYKLSIGDKAYLQYNNVKYNYEIVNIYEVEKDGTVAIYRDYSKNCLTLITCTRNSDTKQTVYILEQIN